MRAINREKYPPEMTTCFGRPASSETARSISPGGTVSCTRATSPARSSTARMNTLASDGTAWRARARLSGLSLIERVTSSRRRC